MNFKEGDKVICINNKNLPEKFIHILIEGEIYTIKEIIKAANGYGFRLYEIPDPNLIVFNGIFKINCWLSHRFKKADNDFSSFKFLRKKKKNKPEEINVNI